MSEAERMNTTLANIPHRIIMSNARRIAARQYARDPNWVLAMNVFGLGSTYAHELCRRAGINPDAKVIA
jgi:ribosomal protein S13